MWEDQKLTKTSLVSFESINGAAWIVPQFGIMCDDSGFLRENWNTSPNKKDRFMYLARSFTDCSGWDEHYAKEDDDDKENLNDVDHSDHNDENEDDNEEEGSINYDIPDDDGIADEEDLEKFQIEDDKARCRRDSDDEDELEDD
jgi:hypothetical protein